MMKFLLLTIITLLPTYLIRFSIGTIPTTFLEILFLLTLFFWCIGKIYRYSLRRGDGERGAPSNPSSEAMRSDGAAIRQDPKPFHELPYFYPTLFLLLSSIIAVIISPNTRAALGLFKAYIIEPMLFFVMFVDTARTWKTVWRDVTIALSLSALGIALPAIYQKFNPIGIPNIHWAAEATRRVTSWYGFPNAIGLYLAPIIPFLVGYAVTTKKLLTRYFLLATAIPVIAAIVLARSEGALGALVVVGIIAGLCVHRTRVGTTVIALMFLIATLTNTPWRDYVYEQVTLQREAGPVRIMQWKEAVAMLRDHPFFGAGLSGYPTTIAPYHKAKHIEIYQYPHNIFLNLWSEVGILGLTAFLWIVLEFTRRTLRQKHYILLASMSVVLIHGLVDVPYFKNDLAIFFWLLLALSTIDKDAQSTLS